MGSTFLTTYIRGGGGLYESCIGKAAKDVGYTLGAEGKGIPVEFTFYGTNYEWYRIDCPLLEADDERADVFVRALSREFKTPALRISCSDSDFAACRIIDGMNGKSNTAFINAPYEGKPSSPPDPSVWTAASKKKWKCTEKQFEEIFSGEYVIAEDGLMKLAALIQLPQESIGCDDPDVGRHKSFWILPEADFEAAPFPRTLAERLAAYIDETFAEKLLGLGYMRFGGSSLRWHKVFGEEGKEIISSIVFVVRYNYSIDIFYGSQALCCPLILTDKYYPMHDFDEYWYEAMFDFSKCMGYELPQEQFFLEGKPELIFPYLDVFIPERLEKVTDYSSLRQFAKESCHFDLHLRDNANPALTGDLSYRMFVEAMLDGDEKETAFWAEKALERHTAALKYHSVDPGVVLGKQTIVDLPWLYREKGVAACLEELKKVRDRNMKKLKRAGVV